MVQTQQLSGISPYVCVCVWFFCLFFNYFHLSDFPFATKLQRVECDNKPPALVSASSPRVVTCSLARRRLRPTDGGYLSLSLSWVQDWHFVRRGRGRGRDSSEEAIFRERRRSTPLAVGRVRVTFSFTGKKKKSCFTGLIILERRSHAGGGR